MSITVTAIRPPEVIGEANKMASYKLVWDNSYPTNGEAIDLTADFEYIYSIVIGGENAAADAAYQITPVFAYGTAITSSNVILAVHWSAGSAAVLAEITDTTDLSALNESKITVFGR
jgi:hypothetical protein